MEYKEFNKLFEKMHKEELDVILSKGQEYTKGDQLDNLKRRADEVGVSPKQVLWIFLSKHLDSISNYIKEGEVLSESIESRIMDARNYLALLRALIEDGNKWHDEELHQPWMSFKVRSTYIPKKKKK